MEIVVDRIDSAVDPRFSGYVSLVQADEARRDPADPLIGSREVEAFTFMHPPDQTRLAFLATVDGEPAGYGFGATISPETHTVRPGFVHAFVLPRLRRLGVGTAIVSELAGALAELDQTSILGDCCHDVDFDASSALCERLGMTNRGEERCSRASVSDIDDELMEQWTDEARITAAGYRLEQWEGPTPDDLLVRWCEARRAMEDEPLDDLDYEPHTRDPDAQRAADLAYRSGGFLSYRTLALDERGEAAGITALDLHADRPQLGRQGDTGVLAAHRGHRLGRWLKAANYQMVRQHQPELDVIETYNAESNRWMLDINVAMGFRPHHVYSSYQAAIGDVLSNCGRVG